MAEDARRAAIRARLPSHPAQQPLLHCGRQAAHQHRQAHHGDPCAALAERECGAARTALRAHGIIPDAAALAPLASTRRLPPRPRGERDLLGRLPVHGFVCAQGATARSELRGMGCVLRHRARGRRRLQRQPSRGLAVIAPPFDCHQTPLHPEHAAPLATTPRVARCRP